MQRLRRLSLSAIVAKVRPNHDPVDYNTTALPCKPQSRSDRSEPRTKLREGSQSPTHRTLSDSETSPGSSNSIDKQRRRLVKKKHLDFSRSKEVQTSRPQNITKLSDAFPVNPPKTHRQKQELPQSQTSQSIPPTHTSEPTQTSSTALSHQEPLLDFSQQTPADDNIPDSPLPDPEPKSPVPLSVILEGDEAPSLRERSSSTGSIHFHIMESQTQDPTQPSEHSEREKKPGSLGIYDRPCNPEPPSLPTTPQDLHWNQCNNHKRHTIPPLFLQFPSHIASLTDAGIETETETETEAETEEGYDTAEEAFDSFPYRSRPYSDSDIHSIQTYRTFHSFPTDSENDENDTDNERYSTPTPTRRMSALFEKEGLMEGGEKEGSMSAKFRLNGDLEEDAAATSSVELEYDGERKVQINGRGNTGCGPGLLDIETDTRRKQCVVSDPKGSHVRMIEAYKNYQIIPHTNQEQYVLPNSDTPDQVTREYPIPPQRETVYYSPPDSPWDVHVSLPASNEDVSLGSPQTPNISESGQDSIMRGQQLLLGNTPFDLPTNSLSKPDSPLPPSQTLDITPPHNPHIESHSQLPNCSQSTGQEGSRSQLCISHDDNDLHKSRADTSASSPLDPQNSIVHSHAHTSRFVEEEKLSFSLPSSSRKAMLEVRDITAKKLSLDVFCSKMLEPIQDIQTPSTLDLNGATQSHTKQNSSATVSLLTTDQSVADDADCTPPRDGSPSSPVHSPALGVGTIVGPLPLGAAAPSPNVGPVILSIADALRTAISLKNTRIANESGSGNVTPSTPVMSVSGRSTPGGLPQIRELEEEPEKEAGMVNALCPRTRREGSASNDTLASSDKGEVLPGHSKDDKNGQMSAVKTGMKTLRRTSASPRLTMRNVSKPSPPSGEASFGPGLGLFYHGVNVSDSHLARTFPTAPSPSPTISASIRSRLSNASPSPSFSTTTAPSLSNRTLSSNISSPASSSRAPLMGGSTRRARASSLTQSLSSFTRSLSFTVRGRNVLRKREPQLSMINSEESLGLDAEQWDVEPWNGRNSGVGTLPLTRALEQIRSKSCDETSRQNYDDTEDNRAILLPLAVGIDAQRCLSPTSEQDRSETPQSQEQWQEQQQRASRKLSKRKKSAAAS